MKPHSQTQRGGGGERAWFQPSPHVLNLINSSAITPPSLTVDVLSYTRDANVGTKYYTAPNLSQHTARKKKKKKNHPVANLKL